MLKAIGYLENSEVSSENVLLSCNIKKQLQVFFKKGVLRNFAKFTGKHLYQSLFFNKVFSCEFCEISNNTLFREHLRWLLLDIYGIQYLLIEFSLQGIVKYSDIRKFQLE